MGTLEAIGAGLAAAGALAVWMWRALRKAKAQGAEQQRAEDAQETVKRVERGQQAINRGRASGDSPDQRLRNNDGKWH